MDINSSSQVFYSPSRHSVIDLVVNGRGAYGGKTLDETRAETADAVLIGIDDAIAMTDAATRSPVCEITREQFWTMLECLPPDDWQHGLGNNSFKMSERDCGNITGIYCQLGADDDGARYFELHDAYTTPHVEIVRRCREFIGQDRG
jgi:hypothetical protein